MSAERALARPEAAVSARWAAGPRGPLRLADGRALRVVFPGVPGPGPGPDFRDAILDAGGDLLRGDVEIHVRASGWRAHGHHTDPAYARVVLHVVEENDTGALTTLHGGLRAVPILVLGAAAAPGLAGFTPPCALAARASPPADALQRLGMRRLRMKAERVAPFALHGGPGPALYGLLLRALGGSANRDAFAALARILPLAVLVERAGGHPSPRALVFTAELRGAMAALAVRRAGLRPMASPARRVESAGALFARLWPGETSGWPASWAGLPSPAALTVPGIGRALAIELIVNAVLPVALAAGVVSEAVVLEHFRALPSPGTYGRLRPLEGWIGGGGLRVFTSSASLQGGLLLHADYCSRGMCGRCPLS